MKNFSFISMIKNFVLANGPGSAKGTTDTNSTSLFSELFAGLLRLLSGFFTAVWGIFINMLYVLAKLCLNIVDLLQYFVQKLVGIDVWQGGIPALSKIKDLGEMDVILRFITQPAVKNVMITVTALSLILVVVFTIIGIIKSNYAAVAEEGDKADNKPMAVIKKALKSMFLIMIVPVVIIFGILGSNAILASICNAINSNSQSSTMGGTIFVASAYDANKYRQYAKEQVRIPMMVSDSTEVVNPIEYNTKNSMMQLMYKSVKGIIKIEAINNSNFFKKKANGTYNGNEGWGEWTKSLSLEEVVLMGETASSSTSLNFSRDFDEFMSELFDGKLLTHLSTSHNIIQSIYHQNITHNKKYKENKFMFSDTVVVDNSIVFSSTSDTVRIYKNSSLYQSYEPFATLQYEYYVMADLIDFAVESGRDFCIVNANSDAIVWDGIVSYNSDFDVYYKENAAIGVESSYYVGNSKTVRDIYDSDGYYKKISDGSFYVSYYDGTNKLYWSEINSHSEESGSTYIICTKTDAGYVPFTHGTDGFKSSFLASGYAGVVVARGIFKPETIMALDYNQPTYISEQYVDNNGYEISTGYIGTDSKYTLLESDFVEYDLGNKSSTEKRSVLSSSKFTSFSFVDENKSEIQIYDKYGSLVKYTNPFTQLANEFDEYPGLQNFFNTLENKSGGEVLDSFVCTSAETHSAYVQVQRMCSNDSLLKKDYLIYKNGIFYHDKNYNFQDIIFVEVKYTVIEFYDFSRGIENLFTTSYILADFEIVGIGSNQDVFYKNFVDIPNNERKYGPFENITSSQHGVFDVYEYLGPQLKTVDGEVGLYNIYNYTAKALEVRDGKVFETGTNKVFFSVNNINKDNILGDKKETPQTSTLKDYNIAAFITNPMNEYTQNSAPFYKAVKESNEVTTVTTYNKYKNEEKSVKFTNVYNDLSLSANDFAKIALVFDKSGNFIDAFVTAYDFSLNNDEADKNFIFYTGFYVSDKISVVQVPISATFSFDYYKNEDLKLDRVYGAQITSVSIGTSTGDPKVDGNNYFTVINNGIYCEKLGKTIMSSADVKSFVIRELKSDSDSEILEYKIKNTKGEVIKSYNLSRNAFSEASWNASSLANFENFYIYFTRGDVSSSGYFDAMIKLNVISFMKLDFDFVFRLKIATAYHYSEEVLYRLSAGAFMLDYNFHNASGIGIKYLYTMVNINPLILVFATLILIATFLKIVWGLIARIYEIVILYILMPAYTSTMPLDDGERFKRWKDAIVEKVLMAYGTLITINIFLLILPLLKNVTDGLISFNDLPKTVTNGLSAIFAGGGGSMFGSIGTNMINFASTIGNFVAETFVKISSFIAQLTESQMVYSNFINKIVYLLFFLVLTTTLSSAPIFINKILGGEDLLEKSNDTRNAVKENIEKVSSYTSGRALKDSAKFARNNTIGALPGGGKLIEKMDDIKKNRSNKKMDKFRKRFHLGKYDPDYQPGGKYWVPKDANEALNYENIERARAGLPPIPVAGTASSANQGASPSVNGQDNPNVVEGENVVENAQSNAQEATTDQGAQNPVVSQDSNADGTTPLSETQTATAGSNDSVQPVPASAAVASSDEDAVIANLSGSIEQLRTRNAELSEKIKLGKFDSPEDEKKIRAEYTKNSKLINKGVADVGNIQLLKSKREAEFAMSETRIVELDRKISEINAKKSANKRRISDSADMDESIISKDDVNKMIAENKKYDAEVAKYQKQKKKVENIRANEAEKTASAKVAEVAKDIASGKVGLDSVTSEQLISSLGKRMSVDKEIDSEIAAHNAKLKTLKNDKNDKKEKLEINGKISALKQMKAYNAAGISSLQKAIDAKIDKNSTKTVETRSGKLAKMDQNIEKISSNIESMNQKKSSNKRRISDSADMDESIISKDDVNKMIAENAKLDKDISRQKKQKSTAEKSRSELESKQIASDIVNNAKSVVNKKTELGSVSTEDLYKVLGSRKIDASKIDKNLADYNKKLKSAKTDADRKTYTDKINEATKLKKSTKIDITTLEKALDMKLGRKSTTTASPKSKTNTATTTASPKPKTNAATTTASPKPKPKPQTNVATDSNPVTDSNTKPKL